MSIASEITRLQNSKADVKTIVNKDKDLINSGTAFIDDETLDDYDDKIEEMQDAYKKFIPIQTGTGTSSVTLDNTNDDKVLTGLKLYGNTEQFTTTGKNLLNVDVSFPISAGGLVLTRDTDGKINISGKVTSQASIYFTTNQTITLPAGTYTLTRPTSLTGVYLIPGYKAGTFTLSEETTFTNVYLALFNTDIGKEVDESFYPMLVSGSSAGDYEPYTGRKSFTFNDLSTGTKGCYW